MFEVRSEATGEVLAVRHTLERANETACVWFVATKEHAVVVEQGTEVVHSRTSYPPDMTRFHEHIERATGIVNQVIRDG